MIRLGLGLRNKAQRLKRWAREKYALSVPWSPGPIRHHWSGRLEDEVGFWRDWLVQKGEPHFPDGFRFRTDPGSPLQPLITEILDTPPGSTARILDVGSGPLTWLGKVWEGRSVEITATDALSDDYNSLFTEVGLIPLVRPIKVNAERLTEVVPPGHFDLATSRNALDHSYDPLEAIRQMVKSVKPGGKVLLMHVLNEAENQGYHGLHQWNFCAHNGKFLIWNMRGHINVGRRLADSAEVMRVEHRPETNEEALRLVGKRTWVAAVLRRRGQQGI